MEGRLCRCAPNLAFSDSVSLLECELVLREDVALDDPLSSAWPELVEEEGERRNKRVIGRVFSNRALAQTDVVE